MCWSPGTTIMPYVWGLRIWQTCISLVKSFLELWLCLMVRSSSFRKTRKMNGLFYNPFSILWSSEKKMLKGMVQLFYVAVNNLIKCILSRSLWTSLELDFWKERWWVRFMQNHLGLLNFVIMPAVPDEKKFQICVSDLVRYLFLKGSCFQFCSCFCEHTIFRMINKWSLLFQREYHWGTMHTLLRRLCIVWTSWYIWEIKHLKSLV